ncbi:MAG: Ig domain-containing protein [Myxococcota bacterium]|jgi:hypothetical protein|nr:Ig domain-containing protein [Myxococcota bacterium]
MKRLFFPILLTSLALFSFACDDSSSTTVPDVIDDTVLPPNCLPNDLRCYGDKLATCDNGVWLLEACPGEQVCRNNACGLLACETGEKACDGNAVRTCLDGGSWSDAEACSEGESCSSGVCLAQTCTPGTKLCQADRVLTCKPDALTWSEEVCDSGWLCFLGECVECVNAEQCNGNECVDGLCQPKALAILTDSLPSAVEGELYDVQLEAEGGLMPYVWTHSSGDLPPGIGLQAAGRLMGTPSQAGTYTFSVQLADDAGDQLTAEYEIVVNGVGLTITTTALPSGEEGMEYSAQLLAQGGTEPYIWGVFSGAPPAGITLSSSGLLSGIPSEIGDFPMTFRVFDSATPPGYADKELNLKIVIAPLEIYGENEIDLFLAKVITLPLLTIVEGIPLPYNTNLLARGGLRPYHWSEVVIPPELGFLIPTGGIPANLSLAEDGTLSGLISTTDQVVTVSIPFTSIELTGFFFMAQVADSQNPAETKMALFLIPTVPIGGN